MSLISVLMPVYNAGPSLGPAIASILAQTHREIELLVIDDASTDSSWDLITRAATADARVRAIRHERNHGLATTLNEGLEGARGDLIARMDQDDVALPERIAVQQEYLDAHPDVAVVGSWVYNMGRTPEHDRLVRLPFTPEQILLRLPESNCVYHPTTMLRRKLILAEGGYRPEFKNAEDYDLWLRLSRRHSLANIPRPLLRYQLSTGGMTIGRKWEQLLHVFVAQELYRDEKASWAEGMQRAQARLARLNRHDYFEHVVTDTCVRLCQLGFADRAFELAGRMQAEMRPAAWQRLQAQLRSVQLRTEGPVR